MIVNEVKITERGWAGHFILADRCLFRRNTLLEYKDKKWVVSTVGAFRDKNKIDTIGHRRWYETMAFEASEKNGYIDANTENKISFDSKWCIWGGDSWKEVCEDCDGTPDNAANDMHDKVVGELINKIKE